MVNGRPSDKAIREAAETAVQALRMIAADAAREAIAEERRRDQTLGRDEPAAEQQHITEDDPQKLWTVRAVAERLDVSPKYVYARIKAGDLPVVELGTGYRAKLRVKDSDVEAFTARRTYGG